MSKFTKVALLSVMLPVLTVGAHAAQPVKEDVSSYSNYTMNTYVKTANANSDISKKTDDSILQDVKGADWQLVDNAVTRQGSL